MTSNNYTEGDTVKIKTSDQEIEGILLPSQDKKHTLIKLESGYNQSIETKKIKETKLVKKQETKSKKEKTDSQKINKNLPTISILHTGGTIASSVDYKTGGVIAQFDPSELVNMFPEIKNIANIKSRLVRQMMSEDMRFAHYNVLGKEIEQEIKNGCDGIVITHGTDTLHYTSAALQFMLEDLPIPVVLIGSQRSSDRGSSDSAINLISALEFIKETDFAEVAICMHENMSDESCLVLPATKTRKMHTTRRDAFRAINTKPWARVKAAKENKKVAFLNKDYKKKDTKRKLILKPFKENIKVGIIKAHANMYKEQFEAYKGFDGVVIEATGLGNIPNAETDEFTKENEKIFQTIEKLIKDKTIVALAPQTIYGRLQLNVYSAVRKEKEAGILGDGSDMTPETTFIKLAWLLSNYDKKEIPELFAKDLRGEISLKISGDEFLTYLI